MGILSTIFDMTPTGYVANKMGDALGPSVINASDQAANIEAINIYFLNAEPINTNASQLKDDWVRWYANLSWYTKNIDSNAAAEAFNRRNAMFRANAETAEEAAFAEGMIKGGPNINPVTGQPILRTSTGERIAAPNPLIPTPYKIAGVIGGVGVLVLVVLKKLSLV